MIKVQLPFDGERVITQRFGGNAGAYKRFSVPGAPLWGHNGIDFALPYNAALLACVDGVVSYVGDDPTGYGRYGVLVDSAGTEWLYGHAARWHVKAGALVSAGKHIADADSTGNSTGNHLHFGRRAAGYNRADGYLGYGNPRPFLPIPYRVLLQAGHRGANPPSGAPGEADWTVALAMKLATLLRKYITCEVVGDYYTKSPPAETYSDWDLYLSLHYDAYQPPGYTSGCCVERFGAEMETWEADRFVNQWKARYPLLTGIPLTMQRVGPNMTDYYGFRPLTAITPGVIAEHGCGQGDDKGKLQDLDGIAQIEASIILSYLGIEWSPEPAPKDDEMKAPTDAELQGMQSYFESLRVPVNMATAIMHRAGTAHFWGEGRGPAVSGEYVTINRDGIKVARQRFSGGTLDYHMEGDSSGQTFWGEVILHPEDAA